MFCSLPSVPSSRLTNITLSYIFKNLAKSTGEKPELLSLGQAREGPGICVDP